jgi:hypothetical protein
VIDDRLKRARERFVTRHPPKRRKALPNSDFVKQSRFRAAQDVIACIHSSLHIRWRKYEDGTLHIYAECADCDRVAGPLPKGDYCCFARGFVAESPNRRIEMAYEAMRAVRE